MRTSSTSGFDLREAVDGLRDDIRDAIEGRIDDRLGRRSGRSGSEPSGRDIRSAILTELSVAPMHGYQLIQAIAARSGGDWTPTAGSVYPTLQLLVDEDLATVAQVGERKVYTLTPAGVVAAAEVTDTEAPPAENRGRRGEQAVAMTKSSVALAQALAQVAQHGTAAQADRAAAIVDEARRKVYAILAED